VVVVMVIVTFVDAGRLVTDVNVQLASEGRPAQVNVTGVEIAVLAETARVTVPDWPPTMLREVGLADTVSAVCVTVTLAVCDEGASLAPSPLKQAATLVMPAPIWAPVMPDAEAVALQLVVQPLAGTKFADANAVPVQAAPE
jgi:hypothetical protein